ncbi:MAG: hypothetical protein CMD99_06100 [Gammaproteobacteria bacterium]|nr:hypothetical protein [Gammaproteobacteria bacterium]|tara:strand:- start:1207 stop:1743 length:537 start_codon:yes stop_codon:yes gene_type:complete
MTSSTEQTQATPSSHRRKHQWIGAATVAALAALVLPWMLTPQFETIRQEGPSLERLPEPPVVSTDPIVSPVIDQKALSASKEKLNTLMNAPIGNESLASFILQIGAFKNRENAQALKEKLEKLEVGRVYLRTEEALTRVYVGPLLDRVSAETVLRKIQTQLSLKAQIKQYDVREHGQS